jgi:hypothetical protein
MSKRYILEARKITWVSHIHKQDALFVDKRWSKNSEAFHGTLRIALGRNGNIREFSRHCR